jgi:hypothetical protein
LSEGLGITARLRTGVLAYELAQDW